MEEVKNTQIKIFEERQVRTIWDKEKEEWYFSVVDVIAVLTDSPNPRNYWKVLKHRLLEDEGSEVVTNCNQLKMQAADGKFYKTDCMTTEQLFRLIQSFRHRKPNLSNFGWRRSRENGLTKSKIRKFQSTVHCSTTVSSDIPKAGSTSG